jgi:hypothetical protein
MAQIIKHRRGSLEALSAVTSSLQKSELVIASGSSNLSVTNGASIVFAVPENGQVQAVNRFLVGANAPNTFAAGTYNGLVKGVPYYASGSSTLYLLGEGANDIPDLTGNISNFSASVSTAINTLSASIGSGTIGTSVAALNTFSGSTLVSLGALNSFSSSQLEKNGTLATYTGSVETRLTEVGVVSGSLIASASAAKTTNDSQDVSITNLNSATASLNTSVSNINSFTQSAQTRFTEIGVVSGSLISSASAAAVANANQNLFTQSAETRFTEIGVVSGSLISSASAAAVAIANLNTNSGSYAKLNGGNHFDGTQVFTGSVFITGSLTVYGSSSFANVSASIVEIGTNIVKLNTATPAVRFGGISVADSGSGAGASGSLFWDSQNNHWIYQHPSGGVESGFTARLISGPANSGSIGNEVGLTVGKLTLAVGDDHLGDSIITQVDNSKVNIGGGLGVSGSIVVNNAIIGTGSIYLQPDITDNRQIQIYNTAGGDTHIKATGGLTFLGDDTNYVKIDDSLQTVTVRGVNGVFIETALNVTGPISASAGFSGSIAGIGNVTAYSQSVSASLAEITANVGSGVGVSITNLNSFSSSTLTRLTALEVETANLELFSGSANTRFTEIGVVSGSLIASASAAKTTNDSQGVSITNLNSFSSSVLTQLTEIGVVSGSLIASASAAKTTNDSQGISITNLNSFSGSQLTQNSTLATYTGSVETRLTEIGVVSGSLISSASAASVSITNLNSKSASVDTSISNINSFTSSFGTTFSSSVDSRLDTLEGTGTIQGVGTGNNVTFAKVTTTGDVVVGGDLVVQGNTVTLNTATLVVEDKLITLASGSTSSATADGAGFEVAGANANFVYQHSTTAFTSSVALIAPAVTASVNLGTAAGSSKRVAFRNTNGNLDLVPTASVAGDLLQWDGTDFVMSNVIDGGSF